MKIHLTDLAIRKLPNPPEGSIKYWDDTTPGFGIRCSSKSKNFVVMFGQDRRLKTLGRYPDLTLSDARTRAKSLLVTLPTRQSAMTLREAAELFLDDCRDRLRPNSVEAYETCLRNLPDTQISKVTKNTVQLTTAHQIKAFKALFNWLIRNEIVDKNPFIHLPTVYGKRERVLTDTELATILQYDHAPYSTIVQLLIRTGQRKNQIWKLVPEWIHDGVIVFPPEIMKQGKSHTIPFTKGTEPYLTRLPFSFNSWSKSKRRIDNHTGVTDWTIHDLRRTFATVHARIGTPIHVVEALLAHSSGTISGVTAVYVRHSFMKEMREAQENYEAWLTKLSDL